MRIKMPAVRIAQADTDPTHSTSGTDQVDLLTCGQCQRVFLLSDICRFVQHKMTGCSKDPLVTNCNSGSGDDCAGPPPSQPPLDNGLSAGKSNSHHRSQSPAGAEDPTSHHHHNHHHRRPPPSSTPKRTSDRNNGGEDGTASSEDEKSSTAVVKSGRVKQGSESSEDLGFKKSNRSALSCVDAESNTTNSEPSSFVCCTCKARFNSSWRLLQHAQTSHSMKIYSDGTPSPVSQSKNNSSCSSLGSSGCSSGNTSSLPGMSALPLALSMPSRLNLHPHPPPPPPPPTSTGPPSMVDNNPMSMPLHNPFGVGGLLRMPMGEPPQRPSPFPGTSPIGNPPLFGRTSGHHQDHQFRMEQLMSEQFRLNQQQHGLGFAVAVAAANAMPTSPFPGLAAAAAANDRNNPRHPAPTLPALNLDPQMDFYSQRLRQLAGTTSPGAATAPSSSPSPRKMTPPFSSPNNNNNNNNHNHINNSVPATTAVTTAPQPNVTATAAVIAGLNNNNNNNSNVSNNNSVESPSEQDRIVGDTSRHTLDLSSNASKDKTCTDIISHPQQHHQIGEEEKTRECEYCGKKFRFLSNLIVHRRTHTGEKPYKCSVCDHACTQSSKLKRHMKTHRRSNRGNGLAGGECGTTPNGVDTSSTPDLTSNDDDEDDSEIDDDDAEIEEEDDGDEDDADEDDEDDEEEEEEEEEEDMELDEEDNDENGEGGDVPEDLTTKSTSSAEHDKKPGGNSSNRTSPDNIPGDRLPQPLPPSSLVGELMSKFGLSNIQQYSEAYKQALKESSSLLPPQFRIRRKDNFRLSSSIIPDNNNGSAKSANPLRNLENGLGGDKTSADIRFREELTKNLLAAGQNPLDLVGAHHGIFGPGSAFENPFDPASKRLKLDPENPHHPLLTRERLYAANMWLPAIAAHHRGESFLGGLPGKPPSSGSGIVGDPGNGGGGGGGRSKPGPSSALSAALNLGLQGGHAKKESRRNDTCEYCGKVFKNCSNLTVHRRSHTGEKPYKCELCSYACAQSSKLTRHMKTHGRLGKDVYRCRFCEMPFSVPSTLEKHMRKCVVNQNIKLEGSQYIKMDDGGSKTAESGGGGYILPPSSMVDDESYSSSVVSKDNT